MYQFYLQYDLYGNLEKVALKESDLATDDIKKSGLSLAIKNGKVYKNKIFKACMTEDEIQDKIDVPIIAIIDNIPFVRLSDIAKYLKVSRQAVSAAKIQKKNIINGTQILWVK